MTLEEIYRQIPASSCKENCGKCCGILFPSLAEIRNIKAWCGSHHVEFKAFNMTVGIDCPYLTAEKKCAIYPVRPFLCRILGVTAEPMMQCADCKPSKIVNKAVSSYLYTQIYLVGKEKPRTEKHKKLLRPILEKVLGGANG